MPDSPIVVKCVDAPYTRKLTERGHEHEEQPPTDYSKGYLFSWNSSRDCHFAFRCLCGSGEWISCMHYHGRETRGIQCRACGRLYRAETQIVIEAVNGDKDG